MNYSWHQVMVTIERTRLIAWLQAALTREEDHLAAREAELREKIADPEVASQMLERLAVGIGQSAARLPSHAQQEIATLAGRIAQIRDSVRSSRNYLIGLQHALDHEIKVSLELVHSLAPSGDVGDDDSDV